MSTLSRVGCPRLSIAMIVRDAEDLLDATLTSVAAIADEIVIVDTGSGDGTRGVASRYGATVIERLWDDDFSAARNHAWNYVTGDWVLWLDAGECLDAEAAAGVRTFVDAQADPAKAYMLLVVVPAAETHIAGEQVGRLRLLPNRPELRFSGRVWERVRPAVDAAGLAIEGLPWRIRRGSQEHFPGVKRRKAQRDLKLAELEIQQRGQQPHLLIGFGEALNNLGDASAGAACFLKALREAPRGSTAMREAYYGLLTCYDADETLRQKQLALCLEALEVFPLDAQLLCAMGGYLQAQGRLDLAARAYRTALEHGHVDPETWHVTDITEIAATCLSLTLQLSHEQEPACQVLEQALARNPGSTRVRRELIELYIKCDRRKDALEQFDLLPLHMPHREALRSAIRGACLAAKHNWTPALAYLQTAYSSGCRDVICLRWLAVALLSTGDQDAALPIVREWRALEPRSIEVNKYLEALLGPQEPALAGLHRPAAGQRHLRIDAGESLADSDLPAIRLGAPIPRIEVISPGMPGMATNS